MADNTTQSIQVQNTFAASDNLKFRYIVDNANDTLAMIPKTYLTAGAGDLASGSLPSGVTFQGDFANIASQLDYVIRNKMLVSQITIQTTDTNNFSEKMIVGSRNINNRNNSEGEIDLTQYRESVGNGYSDTITIKPDAGNTALFMMDQNTYLYIQNLRKNSTTTITLKIAYQEKIGVLQPLNS